MENIQAQTKSNTESAEAAAQVELRKNQALTQSKIQIAQQQAQLDAQKMAQEVASKKELMQMEFQMNMKLKQMEVQTVMGRETQKENRKDERTKLQADQQKNLVDRRNSQQSELIDQRQGGKPPKNFESAGNDTLGGGFDLGAFDPS